MPHANAILHAVLYRATESVLLPTQTFQRTNHPLARLDMLLFRRSAHFVHFLDEYDQSLLDNLKRKLTEIVKDF